jgi:ABC-type polysaccharide/polyol phosphate export permease
VFWIPVYILLLALLSIGVSWIFASLQVYLRDTSQGVAVLLTLWFWATPIFINESQIPDSLKFIPRLNPLTAFVRAYRDLLLTWDAPDAAQLAYAAAVSAGVFLLGGSIFRQLKKGFADVL